MLKVSQAERKRCQLVKWKCSKVYDTLVKVNIQSQLENSKCVIGWCVYHLTMV